MITLVDYGLGNIQAFANIYQRLNIPVAIAGHADELARATRIILPGVGSFDWAMSRLNESGMRDCLDDLVIKQKRPVLGVCVGMQMMAERSEEGQLAGSGWINAEVRKFDESMFSNKTCLPHMGWNDVLPEKTDCLFHGLGTKSPYYFLHSYYFLPETQEVTLAFTDYNYQFVSAVRSENIFGVQFHPEKSHQWGVQLLRNFAEI